MKIVIAGGTGYLGKLLVDFYSKDEKNQVFILTRSQKLNYKTFIIYSGMEFQKATGQRF